MTVLQLSNMETLHIIMSPALRPFRETLFYYGIYTAAHFKGSQNSCKVSCRNPGRCRNEEQETVQKLRKAAFKSVCMCVCEAGCNR